MTESETKGEGREAAIAVQPDISPDNSSPFCDVDEATMRAMTRSLAVLRSMKADSAIYKIDERVFLGSLGVALNPDLLVSAGITHIICVARGIKPCYADRFSYLNIDLLDSVNESLVDRLPEALGFIHATFSASPHSRIFIHCFAGRSRSVAIILAYLQIFHSLSLKSAFHHVRSIRPSANPNSHFMHTLKAVELELQATHFHYDVSLSLHDFIALIQDLIPGVKTRVRLLAHSVSKPQLPHSASAPDGVISWEVQSPLTASAITHPCSQEDAPVDATPSKRSWTMLMLTIPALTVLLSLLLRTVEKFFFPSLGSN